MARELAMHDGRAVGADQLREPDQDDVDEED